MGSYDFKQIERNTDAEAAFSDARHRAGVEHGNRGYTGTIAEKNSFTVVQHTPLTVEDAEGLATRLLREDDPRISDKRGPAGAIPVVFDTRAAQITIPEVTLDANGSHADAQAILADAALAVLRGRRLLRRGEKVAHVEVMVYSTDGQATNAGYYGRGYQSAKERRTNLRAAVTLSKPRSKTTRSAAAAQAPEGWLFFGYAAA